ncbi:hypothetical protein C8F04DRAFT_1399602 [Mycena alexandri]|uniref:BED-type domain-containing protein n=1 Tax=Mycena alexandri TaxID=1745969 RepID=A0AAD6WZZ2_9AGAR|nr:hypothetical protein C8F04DRAFT_1399602 [Mycena alexandri]
MLFIRALPSPSTASWPLRCLLGTPPPSWHIRLCLRATSHRLRYLVRPTLAVLWRALPHRLSAHSLALLWPNTDPRELQFLIPFCKPVDFAVPTPPPPRPPPAQLCASSTFYPAPPHPPRRPCVLQSHLCFPIRRRAPSMRTHPLLRLAICRLSNPALLRRHTRPLSTPRNLKLDSFVDCRSCIRLAAFLAGHGRRTPTPAAPKRRRRQPDPPAEPTTVPGGADNPPAIPHDPPVIPIPAGLDGTPPRARDLFDDDEPDAQRPRANVHFDADDNQDNGEDFPSPVSSSRSTSPTHQPASRRRRHRGSPRAGPHASPLPPLPAPRTKTSGRSGSARDVWTFFEPKEPKGGEKRECLFCKQQHAVDLHVESKKFASSTSSGVLRKHLYKNHLDAWVEGCDKLKIPINAKEASKHVDAYRSRKGQNTGASSNSELGQKRTEFSQEAFVDALVEFIVGDDQSINVVENQQLRAIFLMLRAELKDSDIPHRTKIRKRIIEV